MSLVPAGEELVCDAGGPYTGEINQAVSFTGFASGGTTPYTWAWTFGDGGTAVVQNPTHTYTTAGNYTATLTVTDSAAGTATDTAHRDHYCTSTSARNWSNHRWIRH